ncbi:hypothetical protein [Derxia gummosa]|uniref:Uncharacterized protein n=1 Tax=Derxia gummosa DSM 723 TaxID=1121388 RepID=A0A8B6X558_9BURK|nr:hypothetical protein [Derxia gummosa]
MPSPFSPARLRQLPWRALAVIGAVIAAACAVRYGLMQNDELAVACARQAEGAACEARALLPLFFIENRLGWLALAAGALGFAFGRPALGWIAMAIGAAGLVLYCYDLSAVGAVLGMAAVLRAPDAPASHALA